MTRTRCLFILLLYFTSCTWPRPEPGPREDSGSQMVEDAGQNPDACILSTAPFGGAQMVEVTPCEDLASCAQSAAEPSECISSAECGPNALCINRGGSYHCSCRLGYRRDAGNCLDVNECAEGTAGCDAGVACINEPGSFSCNSGAYDAGTDGGYRVHTLPAVVDAVAEPPYGEVGISRVVNTPLGAYREVGNQAHDRIAYLFGGVVPGELVRLTITYPDDKPRIAEIFLQAGTYRGRWGAYFAQAALASALINGLPHRLSNQMLEQAFYFYVPYANESFAIEIMTSKSQAQQPDGGWRSTPEVEARAPAAIASLRVERVGADQGFSWPKEMAHPNRRKLGLYWEDPMLSPSFSGTNNTGEFFAGNDAGSLIRAVDLQIDYLKRTGQHSVSYPLVWYRGAMFQPSPEYTSYSYRFHPRDFEKIMAARYSREGIDFWPSINTWNLPSLRPYIANASDILDGGVATYVNTVTLDGGVSVDLQRGDQSPLYHGRPPPLNALHPLVRKAMRDVVSDIMDRVGAEPSVRGIQLYLNSSSIFGLGAIDTSYDDYTMGLFSSETGIALPPPPGSPSQRFGKWYQWLKASHWNTWLEWRVRKQTEILSELAAVVSARKPGVKLRVMILYPIPTAGAGRATDNVGNYLKEIGIDLESLSTHQNIEISRGLYAYHYEGTLRGLGESTNYASDTRARAELNFDAGWQGPFMGKAHAVNAHYAYFEWFSFRSEHPECADDRFLENCRSHIWFPLNWRTEGSNFITVTGPKAAGRNGLEFIMRSIASYDGLSVSHGGYNIGSQGIEEFLQPVAASYGSLPAVPFETLSENNGVVLRTVAAEGSQWLYLANATESVQRVSLAFATGGLLERLGLYPATFLVSPDHRWVVTVAPFDLIAWKWKPGCQTP